MPSKKDIARAKKMIAEANSVCALTGAGISVDSGIPDFRSEGGLWTRFDPLEYATYESFLKNPSKFWEMGNYLAGVLLDAEPNQAHEALADFEKHGTMVGIITQNIDNLHQRAGSTRVIELHGNYLRAYCMKCGKEFVGEELHRRVADGETPPLCRECGGVIKSEAILFGEPLPEDAMEEAVEICRSTDLMIVVGTSLQIYPAAFLPQLAKKAGARVVLVNLHGTNRDDIADIVLRGRAEEILPRILDP
ncbi:NAD-dependent deacylase [Candidatus Thorarchaeota archaeon]|nr:MAG: NAD-dependent deacylase [Candidatus Thorarchaeota archaeon]